VTLDLARSGATGNNEALVALSAAAEARQRVHMRYRSARGDDTSRDFDAYGLAFREGRWYAVGMCHLRKGLRSFRLDRVQDVQRLATVFPRPIDFDAVAFVTMGIATLPRAIAVEVLLHTGLDRALAHLHSSIGLFEPIDGGVLLRSQTDDLDWYARQLAQLPFDFSVRTPGDLRAALRAQAARLQKLAKA
jgi:predicted DNA-binding transcriptional regulator YafY